MIREMVAAFKRYWAPTLPKIDSLDLTSPITPESMAALKVALKNNSLDFAVARGPRHIPWNRRRKELEASARQKRRQLESFREEV